jgi:hypothetical protein
MALGAPERDEGVKSFFLRAANGIPVRCQNNSLNQVVPAQRVRDR